MHSPREVEVAITTRCNLRCAYCSHFTSAADVGHDLPTGEWLEFFAELGRLAVMNITLEGGEPFLRKDLPELIEGIVNHRMRFGVLSNGTLITDEMAAFLAATRRCDSVQVSIDGSMPETHDACRGEGNFVRAMNGLQALQRHGVPVSVRVTIHRRNLRDLEGVARLLLEEVGLPNFSTNYASFMGLCRSQADTVQLTTAERSEAMENLHRLNRKYGGRVTGTAGPVAELQDWQEVLQAQQEGRAGLPGRGVLVACGGLFTKLAVRADGVLVPCMQMCHLELGRINRDDLGEVWRRHPELTRLRRRNEIALADFDFCRGCRFIPFCTGNCPALAYTMTGLENHPAPDSCLRRFLEEGGTLPDVH
ncbi:MAG: SynChlorMet cassette radical SAM/SPASM protein ScmE [Deltaproteobacteria bacterium]|nr:SynChlorMet cassette radical SAM/SPASM protein ScmE [Deltaproteobacteria bacterium]